MGEETEALFIVGIGASAGGLEAVRSLLRSAPQNAPAAYVVLQHMSPTQRSLLTPLVARETHLHVVEIDECAAPEANVVYVVPPNSDVVFADGQLKLVPPSRELGSVKPSIDHFFETLADQVGQYAVGIVLSGTGSDGTTGIKAIRAACGATIAQDLETAKYDGMPSAAIASGCIDLVLPPVEIGERLSALSLTDARLAEAIKAEHSPSALSEILHLVLIRSRVDFSGYKQTTILRRIERRMRALNIDDHEAYAAYCRDHDEEVDTLFRDFLISVTSFFRDIVEYDALKVLIAEQVHSIGARPIRVWIAGCATGEEVYSVAILFAEALGGIRAARASGLQIFATDIDDVALKFARRGQYSIATLKDVPADYISTYFEIEGDFANVHHDLKSMVLFSPHNVVQDPPFMNIDLVCCRNLLIYFGPGLQDQAFSNFHYALRDTGAVFIGTADNAAFSTDLFREIEPGKKILQKRMAAATDPARGMRRPGFPRQLPASQRRERGGGAANIKPNGVTPLLTALVRSLGENALLLTHDLRIINVFGNVTPFITLSGDTQRLELDHSLLVDPIASEVRILSSIVKETERSRKGDIRTIDTLPDKTVQIEMHLLADDALGDDHYLLVFEIRDKRDSQVVPEDTPGADGESVQTLRDDLTTTQDALNRTIDKWEAANEELKVANEEMQSNNEELQSLNVELETSNEELQSTNEELITINEAYQVQSDELKEVNEELEAVLDQVEAPLLVYDHELTVSKYSLSASRIFGLEKDDALPHLSQLRVPPEFPQLAPICERVVRMGQRVVEEFVSEGRLFTLTSAPFITADGQIQGGTLFLTTSPEGTELRTLLEQMPSFVVHQKADGTILRASRNWADRYGISFDDAAGRNVAEILRPDEAEQSLNDARAFLQSGSQRDEIMRQMTPPDSTERLSLLMRRTRIPGGADNEDTILQTALDITEQTAYEAALERANAELRLILDKAPFYLMHRDADGTILRVSDAFCRLMGHDPMAILGKNIREFLTEADAQADIEAAASLLAGDAGAERGLVKITIGDGSQRVLDVTRTVLYPGPEKTDRTVCSVAMDVTPTRQTEEPVSV
ncbi:MAG: chemotaxis protein CheB [Pseudomonadota bacterium]